MTPFTERELAILQSALAFARNHPHKLTAVDGPGLDAELDTLHQRLLDEAAPLRSWVHTFQMQPWDPHRDASADTVRAWRFKAMQTDNERFGILVYPMDATDRDDAPGLELSIEINAGLPAVHLTSGMGRDMLLHIHARDRQIELHAESSAPMGQTGGFETLGETAGVYHGAGLVLRHPD